MANLNLTHSGNMNITSASIGPGGTLDVQYEPNNSGYITGWTTNPEKGLADYDYDETLTVRFTPQFSGTVLSETFVVSGYDEAGVRRSDTSVLKQGFDTDVRHYLGTTGSLGLFFPAACVINSSAATANYIDVNITVTTSPSSTSQNFALTLIGSGINKRATYVFDGHIEAPTPTAITSLDVVVPDEIIDYGQASAVYTPSSATVSLVYSSTDARKATIDPVTGEITVLGNGSVTFCVTDRISGLMSCKTVDVSVTSTEPFEIVYNVTSTTEPTWLFYGPVLSAFTGVYAVAGSDDDITGSLVPMTSGSLTGYGYVFPETGSKSILYGIIGTKVPDYAFYASSEWETIVAAYLSSGLTVIGESAFYNQRNLSTLYIPDSMEVIGRNAFDVCESISSLTLNNNLIEIQSGAFGHTSVTSVTIPSSVERIGTNPYGSVVDSNPFYGCENLQSFYGEYAIDNGRLLVIDGVAVSFAPSGLTEYEIPNYVTKLLGALFWECGDLTAVTIPDSVTEIGTQAFLNCSGLTEITLPSSVTYIDEFVFNGCSNMTAMTIEAITPPEGREATPFGPLDYRFPIFVPCESIEDYKTTWSNYSNRFVCRGGEQETYANYIEITTDVIEDTGVITVEPIPTSATIYPLFTSSDPDIASVDPFTGEIVVHQNGSVIITARDVITNKSSQKEITVIPYERMIVTFSGDSAYLYSSGNDGAQDIGLKRIEILANDGSIVDVTSEVGKVRPGVTSKGYLNFTNWSTGSTHTVYYCYNYGTNVRFFLETGMKTITFPEGMTSVSISLDPLHAPTTNKTVTTITIPSTVTSFGGVYGAARLTKIYAYPRTAPTLTHNPVSESFYNAPTNGTLYYPSGSNYSTWMHWLSKKDWTGSPTL